MGGLGEIIFSFYGIYDEMYKHLDWFWILLRPFTAKMHQECKSPSKDGMILFLTCLGCSNGRGSECSFPRNRS